MSSNAIDSVLNEQRVFEPSDEFRAGAQIKSRAEYERLYQEAKDDPEGFWAKIARELHWFKPWDRVLEWKLPFAKWFLGGELNLSYNCLDRHVATWRKNKAAIIWEGEPGDSRTLTYQQLLREVSKCANVLKSLGVKKGDRVAIYMGMVPELPIAMLACARIGAAHTVVFGGFSAQALIDRINDCGAVGGDHAGRGFSPRHRSEAEGSRGSGAAALLHRARTCWCTGAPAASHDAAGPRSLVARADGDRVRRLSGRAAGRRASALSALYFRHHRQTQRHSAHHRRLFGGLLHHRQMDFRSARRRHFLVLGRHRLGDRPHLRRLRHAAERRERGDV